VLDKKDCQRIKNASLFHMPATDKEIEEASPWIFISIIVLSAITFIIHKCS
jgi:hypothetical protein